MKLNFKNTSSETDLKVKLVKKTGTIDTSANENPTLGTTGDTTTFCLAKKPAAGQPTPTTTLIWAFDLNDPTVNDAVTQQAIIVDGTTYQLFDFVQGLVDPAAAKLDYSNVIMPQDTPPNNLPAGFTPYIKLTLTNADPDNNRDISVVNGANAAFVWLIEGINPSFIEVTTGKEFTGALSSNAVVANTPPTVESVPLIELMEGEEKTINIQATDAEGDELIYTMMSFPNRASFDLNSETGVAVIKANDPLWIDNVNMDTILDSADLRVSDGKAYAPLNVELKLTQRPLIIDFPDNFKIRLKDGVPNQRYTLSTIYKGYSINLEAADTDDTGAGDQYGYWYYPDLIGAPNVFDVTAERLSRKTTTAQFKSLGVKYAIVNNSFSGIHPYVNITGANGTKIKVRYWDNVVREYTLGDEVLKIDPSTFNIANVTLTNETEAPNFKPFVHVIADGNVSIDTNADIINVEEQNQTKITTTFQPNKGHVKSQFYAKAANYPSSSNFSDLANGDGWTFNNARGSGTKPESGMYKTGVMLPYVDEGYAFISGERGGSLKLNNSFTQLSHDKDFTIEFFINVLDKSDPAIGDSSSGKINTHILNNGILKLMALKDNINEWTLTGNGASNNTVDVNVALTADNWHHVALINDGATMTTHFMFDGVKVGEVKVGATGRTTTSMGLAYNDQLDAIDVNASQLNFGLNSYRSISGFKMYPVTGFTKPSKQLPLPEKVEPMHKA